MVTIKPSKSKINTKTKNTESFDDIVFKNKNKAYGAYFLRRSYVKSLAIGIAISILCAFIFCIVQYYIFYISKIQRAVNKYTVFQTINLDKIDITSNQSLSKQILNSSKREKNPIHSGQNLIPKIVDSIIEEPVITEEESSGNIGFETDTAGIPTSRVIKTIADTNQTIYYIVDKMPEFTGGDIGLQLYLTTTVKYPKIAQDRGIEGTVYVKFCVTNEGVVDKISILKGVDPILDKEALRVIKILPKWAPGEQHGKSVSVWYVIPISFKLDR